jgi:hypothetical protein
MRQLIYPRAHAMYLLQLTETNNQTRLRFAFLPRPLAISQLGLVHACAIG